jgi:hypothetical protein
MKEAYFAEDGKLEDSFSQLPEAIQEDLRTVEEKTEAIRDNDATEETYLDVAKRLDGLDGIISEDRGKELRATDYAFDLMISALVDQDQFELDEGFYDVEASSGDSEAALREAQMIYVMERLESGAESYVNEFVGN